MDSLVRQLGRCLLLCYLGFVALIFTTVAAHATIYDVIETGGDRALRLNIPDSIGSRGVRGILFVCNSFLGSSLDAATDPELVAFASSIDFAIIGTRLWYNFSESDDEEILLFESLISDLAATSGHSELVNAPWLTTGFSNGGQMSYGLAAKRPAKTIAFITSKGAYYNTTTPSEATRKVPGLLIAGELDYQESRDAVELLYTTNRALGALWSWVEEPDVDHQEYNENHIKLPFLAEAYRLRYPAYELPVNGPVVLNDLVASDGWLVDHTTWASGFTDIYSFSEIASDQLDDVLNYGWVLNQKLAMLYRGFSSKNKATNNVSTISSPIDISSTVQYTPSLLNGLNWTKVEAFVDGFSLGSVNAGMTPTWNVDFTYGGMYTFHSIVTLADNSMRVSYLNRVFIDGEMPQTPFDNWLYDTYEPAMQSSSAIPSGASDSLIESYAFDLMNSPGNRPNVVSFQSGAFYYFSQRAGLVGSGVELEVQVATDFVNGPWLAVPTDAPSHQAFGNFTVIQLSLDDAPSKFARVKLSIDDEMPQTPFDYWLYDTYGAPLQSPDTVPSGASDSLIESYAFDLLNAPSNRPTVLLSEAGVDFQFTQRAGLVGTGVELEVQVTTDLVNGPWLAVHSDDPSYEINDNVVTIDLSLDDGPSKFARVKLLVSE